MNKIALSPQTLFLIDGLGALLSAFLLGIVLTYFESTFGMPHKVLYFLSAFACLFALYSFWNYWKFKENWKPYLRVIATVNLLYCLLTASLVIYFRQELTTWGCLYFLLEMMVIIGLVVLEFKTVGK